MGERLEDRLFPNFAAGSRIVQIGSHRLGPEVRERFRPQRFEAFDSDPGRVLGWAEEMKALPAQPVRHAISPEIAATN